MKRFLISLILLFTAGAAASREVYNVNRDWKFFSSSDVSSDAALTVNLPHMWNHDALGGKRDYFRGVGNYIKEVEVPLSWRGKRVFVKCYGANSTSTVFINGKHVGEHKGGYTAFAYEVTDFLQYGRKNFVWIAVNNSPRSDVLPTAGDANCYGGIFRDVEVIVTGSEIVALTDHASDGIYIEQRNISQAKAEATARIMVSGVHDNNNVMASLRVYTADGDTVVRQESRVKLSGRTVSTVNIPFAIDNPHLWNGTFDPYMYTVEVRIFNGGQLTDRVVTRTGFRYFHVDPKGGFHLNGKPYPLRGVYVRQDRASVGNALTTYQVREDFDLITEMGANAVRVTGVNHHPEFYRLCDRNGILVWNDFPLMGGAYMTDRAFFNTHAFRENGREQVTRIIRQLLNHPSIVMWGIFSELGTRGDNPIDFISELNMLTRREDPSRLTVAASNEDGEINFITDLVVWDHFFGWKEGLPSDIEIWRRELHSNWQGLRSGVSYGAGASIYHQEDSLYRPAFMGNWHPERWQTHLHEQYFEHLRADSLFWGIFPGNMFDYGAAGRTWGEGNGINDTGLVTFDRKYCKDSFYFYKANWNSEEPFVYLAERRWNKRGSAVQDIKVYSNCAEMELIVNGVSEGRLETPHNGTFVWERLQLRPGVNFIEARSGNHFDRMRIEITPREPM